MRKLLEHKLQEFADKRRYAETAIRKEFVNFEVRKYLKRRCIDDDEYNVAYRHYKKL